MASGRITYQNWIVDIGYDPNKIRDENSTHNLDNIISLDDPDYRNLLDRLTAKEKNQDNIADSIRREVSEALDTLNLEEREFIIHFYYMGESYREISEKTGRAIYKLTALHNRSIKKLKNRLAVFVRDRFDVKNKKNSKCLICSSEYRSEIDKIIANRDKKATWKPVIKLLKDRYGLVIKTPQVLIGHVRYHCQSKH